MMSDYLVIYGVKFGYHNLKHLITYNLITVVAIGLNCFFQGPSFHHCQMSQIPGSPLHHGALQQLDGRQFQRRSGPSGGSQVHRCPPKIFLVVAVTTPSKKKKNKNSPFGFGGAKAAKVVSRFHVSTAFCWPLPPVTLKGPSQPKPNKEVLKHFHPNMLP
jgi:hypothetical protein